MEKPTRKFPAAVRGRSSPPMESAWGRLVKDIEARRLRPGSSEDVPRVEDLVTRLDFGPDKRRVLVSSKTDWVLRLLAIGGALPSRFGVVHRCGLASPEFTTVLRRVLEPWKARVFFVGDLDPFDLASFRALQLGDPYLRPASRPVFRVRYAGIDAEWLDRCLRHAPGRRHCIRLSAFEQREWVALRASWPTVGRVIGHSARALLDGGNKLELEGASNPRLHPPEHLEWVRAGLLEAAGPGGA